MIMEAAGEIKYGDKGNMTTAEIEELDEFDTDGDPVRTAQRVVYVVASVSPPPKRLLKRATWPPVSSWRLPPVQAGCEVGSMSRDIVSPSLPQVERVW